MASSPSPAGETTSRAPPEWSVTYLLARVFYAIRSRSEEGLRPHNLTPMQFTILSGLQRWTGVSSAELSRRFEVTPQTMGEMIANLERRGLVTRRQDPRNRRALKLELTAEGQRVAKLSTEEIGRIERELVGSMSPETAEGLRRGLGELFDRLGLKIGL